METSDGAKRVTITFNEKTHRPEYVFEGRWVGRDATLASNKLWKNYRSYIREKVLANKAKEEKQEKEVNEAIAKAKEIDNAKRTSPARAGKTSTGTGRKTK